MSTSSSSSCSYSSLFCLSPWCSDSTVLLTLVLAVLALVLAEVALDFKNKSVSLPHFHHQPTVLSEISLSFLRSPLVSLDASIHFFASLISVNFQLPTTTQMVYSIQSQNSQKALLHLNFCKQIIKRKCQ